MATRVSMKSLNFMHKLTATSLCVILAIAMHTRSTTKSFTTAKYLLAVNGGWGSWTAWSLCSVTCGSGQRTRERFCNNPIPSGGGSDCSDSSNDQQTCTLTDCPSNICANTTKHR